MNKLTVFFGAWAIAATVGLAWVAGRNSVAPIPAATAPIPIAASSPSRSATRPPISSPTPKPPAVVYPQFTSTVPKAFRGSWDEMIADKCEGREARFNFGARNFDNFEMAWEVTNVKLYSPTEMDMSTTMKDENASQVDQVWQFKLVDGGRTLTGRRASAEFYKKCPSS